MEKREHGGNIYRERVRLDFSASLNPLGMPRPVAEAAIEGVGESTAYPDPEARALREAIAGMRGAMPEQVICGAGAADLIHLFVRALGPERALLPAPGFSEYEAAVTAAGGTCSFYETPAENGFAPGEELMEALGRETDLVVLCTPSSPSGALCDRALLRQVLAECARRGIWILADECFLGLVSEGERWSLAGAVPEYDRLFVLDAFTKSFAMPGLRLGYGLCGNEEMLKVMRALRQPWAVSLPAQLAGIAAAGEKAFLAESREKIALWRGQLEEALRKRGFAVFPGRANYLLFTGPEDLGRHLMEKGILIRDCRNFRGLGPGYFRTAVKTPEENAALLAALDELSGEVKE